MSRQPFLRNRIVTRQQLQRMGPVPSIWNEDKVPPLVTAAKQRQESIPSLNQSEVRSIYTVDREEFDKHVIDMMNGSSRRKGDRHGQPMIISESEEQTFQTPINNLKKQQLESTHRDSISGFREEKDYGSCAAVRLYQQLVQSTLKQPKAQADRLELEWMKSKSASQLLANVLTNRGRLNLYVHYLLNEIYVNEQARIVNELHQEEVQPYNPTIKETYSNILCLLGKVSAIGKEREQRGGRRSSSPNAQKPKILLFQNGMCIDINPKLNELKRERAVKIRQIKQTMADRELQFQQSKKVYDQIVGNYLAVMENLKEEEEVVHPPIQQSLVKLVFDEEEEAVRKKHHTFGMKQVSGRSSKAEKQKPEK